MSSLQTKHSSNLINNDGNTDEDYSNMHLSRLDFASSSSPAQDREHWDVSRVVSPPGKELGQSNVESLEGTGMSVVAENIDWSSESFPAPIPNLSFNWLQNMYVMKFHRRHTGTLRFHSDHEDIGICQRMTIRKPSFSTPGLPQTQNLK